MTSKNNIILTNNKITITTQKDDKSSLLEITDDYIKLEVKDDKTSSMIDLRANKIDLKVDLLLVTGKIIKIINTDKVEKALSFKNILFEATNDLKIFATKFEIV